MNDIYIEQEKIMVKVSGKFRIEWNLKYVE